MPAPTVTSFLSSNVMPSLRRGRHIRGPMSPRTDGAHLHVISEVSEESEQRSSWSSLSSHSDTSTSSDEESLYHPSVAKYVPSPIGGLRSESVDGASVEPRHAKTEMSSPARDKLLLRPSPSGLPRARPLSSVHMRSPSPSPSPSRRIWSPTPSSEHFRVDLHSLGISLDFPYPPSPSESLRTPTASHGDGLRSPAPSLSSSATQSPRSAHSNYNNSLPATPTTSDEEFRTASPRRPLRLIIKPLVIVKSKHDQPKGNAHPFSSDPACDTESGRISAGVDVEDEVEWYSRELGQVFTLSSPLPNPAPARRESVFLTPLSPKPLIRRRASKALPAIPANSQHYASFRRRSTPSSETLSRAPPSPPLPSSPFRRARYSARPPPRMSIPADVYGLEEWEVVVDEIGSTALEKHAEDDVDDRDDLDANTVDVHLPLGLPLQLPASPLDVESIIGSYSTDIMSSASPARPDSPLGSMYEGDNGRSRWSMSTLASPVEERRTGSATSSRMRFYFGGQKKAWGKRITSPTSPLGSRHLTNHH